MVLHEITKEGFILLYISIALYSTAFLLNGFILFLSIADPSLRKRKYHLGCLLLSVLVFLGVSDV
jgi:hypothetical protein